MAHKRTNLRAALIQQQWRGDALQMREATEAALRRAAAAGADLAVCQELQAGPYFCQREDVALHDLAEPIPGPSTQFYGDAGCRLRPIACWRRSGFHFVSLDRRAQRLQYPEKMIAQSRILLGVGNE